MIARLLAALLRRFRRTTPLDRRWARHVDAALDDRRRFDEAVARIADPAIRTAVADVGTRLDQAVDAVRTVAERGQALELAARRLPNRSFLEHELSNLVARGLPDDDSRVAAAREQLATIDRVRASIDDVEERLERIDADLDVSIVRAVEAGVTSSEDPALDELRAAVNATVHELEALNRAIIEVGRIG